MMNKLLEEQYFNSAIYALAVGTPRDVIHYAEEHFANEDNFEAASGFKRAIEVFHTETNCRVIMPDGFDLIFDNEQDDEYDEEDISDNYE